MAVGSGVFVAVGTGVMVTVGVGVMVAVGSGVDFGAQAVSISIIVDANMIFFTILPNRFQWSSSVAAFSLA